MISVITPSVRPEMLEIVRKCLGRQTFKDFEWIIVGPEKEFREMKDKFSDIDGGWRGRIRIGGGGNYLVIEPLKRPEDYYRLNGAYNEGFRQSDGELIVSIQDGLWFPPDLLEKFWNHYQANPTSIVGALGHQYDQIDNGKPEHMIWRDPRCRTDFGSFYEVEPSEVEYTIASIPRKAIFDVGGIDEEYDKYAALSEKDLNYRMEKLGYKFYLDQGIEYRAIHHPRLSEEWDKRYEAGCVYYQQCRKDILEDKRVILDYLS